MRSWAGLHSCDSLTDQPLQFFDKKPRLYAQNKHRNNHLKTIKIHILLKYFSFISSRRTLKRNTEGVLMKKHLELLAVCLVFNIGCGATGTDESELLADTSPVLETTQLNPLTLRLSSLLPTRPTDIILGP